MVVHVTHFVAWCSACVWLCARARGPPLDQLATHVVCCARRGCGLACCALS